MAKDTITTKFKVDISDLQKNITTANRTMRLSKAEFNASSAGLKNWEKTSTGLSAKLKQLETNITAQTTKLKVYKQQLSQVENAEAENKKRADELRNSYKQAVAQYGENSTEAKQYAKALAEVEKEIENNGKEAENLKIKMLNQEATVKNTTSEMNDYKEKLRAVEDGTEEAENASKKFDKSLDNINKSSREANSGVTKLKGGFTVLKGVCANLATDALRFLGDKLKETLKGGIELASDLNEVQNVVDVSFGKSSKTVNKFATEASTAYGMSELSAKQYSGTLGAMLKSMGLSQKEVLKMSLSMTGLTGDMASFYNLDHETAFEKIRSGISGETEPLKQLGINMSVANLEAFALSQGIKKPYNSMKQGEQALLRYKYLMSVTKDAQGDFTRTSGEYANQQRVLELQLQNTSATFGKSLLPTVNEVTKSINSFLSSDTTQTHISNISKELGSFVKGTLQNAVSLAKTASSHSKEIKTVLTGLTGAIITYKTAKAGANTLDSIGTSIMKLSTKQIITETGAKMVNITSTKGATTATKLLTLAQKATPWGMIAGLIVGATTALIAYSRATDKSTKEAQKKADSAKQEAEEWKSLTSSRDKSIQSTVSEIEYSKQLRSELSSLVTSNGKVKKGDEDRVNFILKDLNEAYGTEMSIVDGTINGYNKQSKALDNLIEKKRAEAIINAGKEAYETAVQKQAKAYQDLEKAEADYLPFKQKFDSAVESYVQKGVDRVSAERLAKQNDWSKEAEAYKQAYEKKSSTAESYTQTIADYENKLMLFQKGDAKSLEQINNNTVTSYKNKGKNVTEAIKAELNAEQAKHDDLVKLYAQDPSNKQYKNQIEASNKRILALKKEMKASESTVSQGGKKVTDQYKKTQDNSVKAVKASNPKFQSATTSNVNSMSKGIDAKKRSMYNKGVELANNTIKGVNTGKSKMQTAGDSQGSAYGKKLSSKKGEVKSSGVAIGQAGASGASSQSKAYRSAGTSSGSKLNAGLKSFAGTISSTSLTMGRNGAIKFKSADFRGAGLSASSGINAGIQSGQSSIFTTLWNLGSRAVAHFKKSIDSHSPSKKFAKASGSIPTGIAQGVYKNEKFVTKAITTLAKNSLKTFKKANGNYEKAGESVVKNFEKGVNSKVKSSEKAVTKLVNKQVKALTKANKKNKSKYEKMGKSIIKSYTDSVEKEAKKAIAKVEKAITKIAESAQAKYDDIIDKRSELKDSLSAFDLFTTDEDGNMVLTDLNAQSKALSKYGNDLLNLKKKLPAGLMNEILGMDLEEGQAYTQRLLSMSSSELNNYITAYKNKEKIANDISKKYYQGELDKIKKDFNDKVTAQMKTLQKDLKSIGKNSMQGFINGMKSKQKSLDKEVQKIAKSVIKAFNKKLKIHSPSKVFYDSGANSTLGYVNGFVGSMKKYKNKLTGSVPVQAFNNAMGVGSAGNGSGNVQNVTFTQNLYSPKPVNHLEAYRQGKNLSSLMARRLQSV